MFNTILIIHIMLCNLLIVTILINRGKGAEVGATFDSSTESIFGSKGSSSILNKAIMFLALLSLISNIMIGVTKTNKNISEKIINVNICQLYKNNIIKSE